MARGRVTRQRLQQCALALFEERGFDEVTVEEVAAAAGVSHMTFYRHFPTKESVVLDDPYDPVIGDMVRAQDVSMSPILRAVGGVLAAWSTVEPVEDGEVRARLRLAAAHAGLRARAWENNHRTEQVIVEALTATGVELLEARVAAGAVMGALTAALFDWGAREDGSLDERIVRTLGVLGAAAAHGSPQGAAP